MKLLKIIGIILLVLMVVLIPLFGTYVATVQALPNERIYPIKRQAEKVIDTLSMVTPEAYAYFSLLKAKRRYQEIIGTVSKNQEITGVDQEFLAQSRQTLLDIQSIPNENNRINFYAQYQEFIHTAGENFKYQIDLLQTELQKPKSARVKTFTINEFSGTEGRLVAKPTTLVQQSLVEEKVVEDSLLQANIEKLQVLKQEMDGLVKR